MFIFTILLKKANEDIAQGTKNYNEFSVVCRNLKSEFVTIKTVNVETGEEDYSNLQMIINFMRTLANQGVGKGEYEHYFSWRIILVMNF